MTVGAPHSANGDDRREREGGGSEQTGGGEWSGVVDGTGWTQVDATGGSDEGP